MQAECRVKLACYAEAQPDFAREGKGELAAARKATDEAIRKAYDVINALNVLAPSAELSALINVLFGIEERAKLYYISGASASGTRPTPSPDNGGGTDSGTTDPGNGGTTDTPTDPTTPDNPTPDNPGGGDNGGGYDGPGPDDNGGYNNE